MGIVEMVVNMLVDMLKREKSIFVPNLIDEEFQETCIEQNISINGGKLEFYNDEVVGKYYYL